MEEIKQFDIPKPPPGEDPAYKSALMHNLYTRKRHGDYLHQQIADTIDRLGHRLRTFRGIPAAIMKLARNDSKRSRAGRWYSGRRQAVTLSGGLRRAALREVLA